MAGGESSALSVIHRLLITRCYAAVCTHPCYLFCFYNPGEFPSLKNEQFIIFETYNLMFFCFVFLNEHGHISKIRKLLFLFKK